MRATWTKRENDLTEAGIRGLERELEDILSGDQNNPQRLFARCGYLMQQTEESAYHESTAEELARLTAVYDKAREAAKRFWWTIGREMLHEATGYDVGE